MIYRLRPSNRGVALVLVLAFLVLISVLVIAFFSSVTTELTSSKSYAFGANARQLADTSVQTVMGQIRDATTKGNKVAWASQPGMIRTYDDSGESVSYYKLYSSENMIVTKSQIQSFTPGSDVDPAWNTKPGLFADLNTPVLVSDTANPSTIYPVFPIIDPRAMGKGSNSPVEGFSYSAKVGSTNVAGVTIPASSSDNAARLPMPVKWLYVLKDGTLTAPTDYDVSKQIASWTGATSYKVPSATNPIVGRIAFWADDETCKINVNTASEPTAWDTPRSINIQDLNYGKYQPAQSEYQRFSGHPFMTALSPVFFPNTILTSSQKQVIYDAVPRVAWGGSESGTRPINSLSKVTMDSDRLFASVDEFLFRPDRGLAGLVDAGALKRSRFFLTANSRAPEVNLFGQPRVSIWPVNYNEGSRTAYDRLAAFCATVGDVNASSPQNFSFQRSNATSPTNDWTNIPRNQDLIKYLKRLTSANIPGFGGHFLAKWSGDRDQVLTEIFDYVRCANLRDRQSGATQYAPRGQVAPIQVNDTKGFGRFHTISQFGLHFIGSEDTAGERAIETGFLFQPFSPSQGFYVLQEDMSFEITFKTPMKVDDKDLQFPPGPVVVRGGGGFSGVWHGRNWGGSAGLRGPLQSFGGGGYPLVGKRLKVAVSGSKNTMRFSGGEVVVNIYSGGGVNPANLIQTISVKFPAADFPIPTVVQTGTSGYRGAGATDAAGWRSISNRYGWSGACPHVPGPAEYPDINRQWPPTTGPSGFKQGGIFRAEDVVRTMVPPHGDIRIIAGRKNVDSSLFGKGAFYDDTTRNLDHIFVEPEGTQLFYGYANEPGLTSATGDQLTAAAYHYSRLPEITPGAGKKYNKWNDFDNGSAHIIDGAYINKPDEGNFTVTNDYAYFAWNFSEPGEVMFSPNRLVPSAGMFGSLPTGVVRNQPWQTLLFRPQAGHPGEGTPSSGPPYTSPPDHLLMDLFWMPVIEPYAISEPFSTAGKVNLNYEMAPFSYIRRATALHAAFKSEEPLLIPTSALPGSPNGASKIYKLWDHQATDCCGLPNGAASSGAAPNAGGSLDRQVYADWDKAYKGTAPFDQMRRPIDMTQTLKQADDRFAAGKAFRSATQVSELHLVRNGESLSDYLSNNIWPNNLVTGENTREKPYTALYARLTTKSNSYTVHMRVQVLKKKTATTPEDDSIWRENVDQVVSEFRGATLLERYLDSGAQFPDFVSGTSTTSLEDFYRFRTISTKRFVP
ncbi:MAG: Verru_Chthon cassette protein A [Chthoniobacter sp.]|nr:Verru_Chthon cassette protein A [Chthoniobacter sp.]